MAKKSRSRTSAPGSNEAIAILAGTEAAAAVLGAVGAVVAELLRGIPISRVEREIRCCSVPRLRSGALRESGRQERRQAAPAWSSGDRRKRSGGARSRKIKESPAQSSRAEKTSGAAKKAVRTVKKIASSAGRPAAKGQSESRR